MRKKLYYPASHIITGLHTIGKEYMYSNGVEYIGHYHKYVDGTVMTGYNFDSTISVELVSYKSSHTNTSLHPDVHLYNSISSVVDKYTTPVLYFPTVTLEDYKNGFIDRYFICKRNSSYDIIEVDSQQFKSIGTSDSGIDGNLYSTMSLTWKLTGPQFDIKKESNITYGVYNTNKRTLSLKDIEMPGITQYLTDYIELSIYSLAVSKDIKETFGIK